MIVQLKGWAMQTALFIFLKRKWDADKVILKRFLDYYKQIHKNVIVSLSYRKPYFKSTDLKINPNKK